MKMIYRPFYPSFSPIDKLEAISWARSHKRDLRISVGGTNFSSLEKAILYINERAEGRLCFIRKIKLNCEKIQALIQERDVEIDSVLICVPSDGGYQVVDDEIVL